MSALQSKTRGYVRASDLDDLHPCLMYGALFSFLRALANSLIVIIPAVLSWRVVVVAVSAVVVVYLFMPLGMLGFIFMLGEFCFAVWLRLVRRRLQSPKPLAERLAPPTNSLDVFRRTLDCVEESAAWGGLQQGGRSPTQWLEGWFLGIPLANIQRGNMLEWLAWSFFTKQEIELKDCERQIVCNMLDECERRFKWCFEDGRNPGATPIRINFDQFQVWCHPLLYYMGVRTLTMAARQTMRLMGFVYHRGCVGDLAFFRYLPSYPREGPGFLIRGGVPVPSARPPPIVFIHGLGVGLPPYLRFIRRLAGIRECFVLELPEVSQAGTETALSPTAMSEAIAAMLRAFGHTSACFVAHSYGTFVLSWMLRAQPDLVAKAVLLDPVCFLLAQPDVAFNFLYRRPSNPFLLMVAHFVRWELFSANVLTRQFYWYHNVLWQDELPEQCVVVVSGGDDIINARAVRRYLEEHQKRQAAANGKMDPHQLQLLWFEGFFHGEVLISKSAQLQIMELL